MRATIQSALQGKSRAARFAVAGASALVWLVSGCAQRQAKAPFPWSTYAYTRPLTPASLPLQAEDGGDPLADVIPEIPPPPSTLVIASRAPLRPRVPVTPASPNDPDTKPAVPRIAPQLTPAEASAAQQETTQSLSVAERNIGSAGGKTLNATQQDLASKIHSFMLEAQEAAKSGDWTRAKTAAKKAEVLSQELASSL